MRYKYSARKTKGSQYRTETRKRSADFPKTHQFSVQPLPLPTRCDAQLRFHAGQGGVYREQRCNRAVVRH